MAYAYRFLDDIALADLAFEAEGDSLEEVFRGATEALLSALANPVTVGTAWERAITRNEADLPTLLFEWLSDIIYWKDAAGMVFHDVPKLTITNNGGHWMLEARLTGAPVDQHSQELRNDVKGITKHLYHLIQEGQRWKARVILDV